MDKTRQRGRPQKTPSKLCIKCNKVLPLGDFYPNKDWVAQTNRDAWCRECANKYCVDMETMQQYCSQNNRRWNSSCWEKANQKATSAVANNPEYVSPKTSPTKRKKILEKTAVNQYFSMMNLVPFYAYINNTDENGMYVGDEFDYSQKDEDPANIPVYDREWRGTYTPEQIEILNEQYRKLEAEFDLGDENRRDYARKTCRASLMADMAEDKYRRGDISLKEYKDAMSVFDNLSKSSELAACRKKPGDTSGIGTLGEIILNVEINGYLNTRQDDFPKDQIDEIMDNFYHTFVAAGIRGEL